MKTLTRLQPGMTVLFAGAPHRVVLVNECRARLVPVAKIKKTVMLAGKAVTFTGDDGALNVSPESELEIVARGAQHDTRGACAPQLES